MNEFDEFVEYLKVERAHYLKSLNQQAKIRNESIAKETEYQWMLGCAYALECAINRATGKE